MRHVSAICGSGTRAALGAAAGIALAALAAAGEIGFVGVGDAGNPADALGCGAVAYEYRIGTYEITNAQWTAFLNAVAADDTYELYNPGMRIARAGQPGAYAYTTAEGPKPVTFVSWFDSIRFANWLHHGMPAGPQDATTTEDGAYALLGADEAGPRKAGARAFLPTEDEWCKAAYFRGAEGYAEYPLPLGVVPLAAPPGALAGSANFDRAVADATPAGAYTESASYYGTFDQAGNVWEWVETEIDGERGIRGGSWDDYALLLGAGYRDSDRPAAEYEVLGFRIAASVAVEAFFRRGDVNQDGPIDIADPISMLGYLFAHAAPPRCLSSADANDDGKTDIADAVKLLSHLFGGVAALPPPFGACGADPTPDMLGCMEFAPCGQ